MKRKTMISLALAFLMTTSVAFAAKKEQSLKCNFRDIKVKKNGQMLKVTREPFIYDGTTFLPLRDVTEGLGYKVGWDDATSTVLITGGESADTTLLQQDLRNKDIMMQQMQNQIKVLKDENDKLKKQLKDAKDDEDDDDDDKDVKDLKNDLEDDYEKYTKGKDDLKFDFDLDSSKSKIEIEMEGDFKRTGDEWEKRDDKDFRGYMEDIAKKAAKDLDKDVEITVKDKDKKDCGEYSCDEKGKNFKYKSEYDKDDEDDDDGKVDDLEKDLKDDYEKYSDGNDDLKFDFDLDDSKSKIAIEMEGDFKRTGDEWEKRDDKDFRDYMEDIAKKAAKDLDKDVEITVKDKDKKDCGEYSYDESKKDFKVKEEYGSDSDDSDDNDVKDDIEKMLKDDYDEYTKGKKDLEFKYNVKVKDDTVEITMILQDYDKDDDEWEDRDDDEFDAFMKDLAEDIAKIKKDTDVEIEVYSEKDDNKKIDGKDFDAKDID